ncbi:hypothetical protein NQ176_g6502 [Zarea fungicola]|uniref:Uncharacterized protein n=1 Tax=Zarea fungicola TaxID=93591 RepID=A0ACC1N597_9HYPO|nr:hypothetical protein NQ176_g6502 [Lecanicillium fungicola]
MKFTIASLLAASLVAADGVTFQLYNGPSCNQNKLKPDKVVANINSNSGADKSSSGCIAATFKSGKFIKFQNGFKCNIYKDSGCADFIGAVTAQDGCDSFPGGSVQCFNQAEFDNPFTDSKVSITVGSKDVGVSQNTGSLFIEGIGQACGDTGCDPTNKRSFPYRHFNQNGFTSISVTGTYANTNQRDYMKAILVAVQTKTLHDLGVDLKGSSANDNLTANQFTFFQVVIRDRNGSIQAQMTATVDTTTQKQKEGDCGLVGDVEKFALSQIPAVGGLAAKAFDIVCKKAG